MSAGTDIANFWLTDSEALTVTYTKADGTTSTATARAKIVERDYRDMQMGGPVGLEPDDQVWSVGAVTLAGLEFQRGGMITDGAGAVWVVQTFRPRYAGGVVESWRALCRKRL